MIICPCTTYVHSTYIQAFVITQENTENFKTGRLKTMMLFVMKLTYHNKIKYKHIVYNWNVKKKMNSWKLTLKPKTPKKYQINETCNNKKQGKWKSKRYKMGLKVTRIKVFTEKYKRKRGVCYV